jgi:hypothetical protein
MMYMQRRPAAWRCHLVHNRELIAGLISAEHHSQGISKGVKVLARTGLNDGGSER